MSVPLRHSLVARLLVMSVAIAVISVAATAWLATRTATQAIRQEQGRSLAGEKALYDTLIDYAATRRDWSGVRPLLAERADDLDRRITLTALTDGAVVAQSSAGPAPPAGTQPSATVDPLRIDTTLTGGSSRIDARVLGPYVLTDQESAALDDAAVSLMRCLTATGGVDLDDVEIVRAASGRPTVETAAGVDAAVLADCRARNPSPVTATERAALLDLGRLVTDCLGAGGTTRRPVTVPRATTATSVLLDQDSWYTGPDTAQARTCLEQARREQLQPYVAPAVQLFVTDPDTGQAGTAFTLSNGNVVRIVAVTGGVLLATILVTVLLGRRLVRPLRALTDGAARQEPVTLTSKDEFAYLARALNEARERRDRSEAQRRAMVGDVAHELRNPLTTIRGWLEAAQDGLTPTDRPLVDLLHDETMLLQHVIDDLADLAAADAGTFRVHREPLELNDVLVPVLEAHQGAADAAGVVLRADVEGEPTLTADAVRLRQLVGNLVSNGLRYTPAGGTVTVNARSDGDLVTVAVEDTGTGIAPEHLDKVFDRFWRADTSRTRASGGSGLGLAVVRQITELHDGTIEVESRLGEGTTFTVRLPAHSATACDTA
ncbi:sensor histidine kinase [Kineosporia succinea]|uniref:histidine kinase n=1 Tax=Kineosporia succinea TaxID=84632 RepID=A0ABT9PE76_9ACTN|nr:sensor histidine kinase [Kineosporia succinea]MDP9830699.1 two-component system sensor histidine kinase BaeS [Kineosporia succinea]